MHNPYEDKLCDQLATYLSKGLNYHLDAFNKDNPHLKLWDKAVIGFRSYDAFDVPLNEFPLLKVFRVADNFKPRSDKSVVSLRCSYCLAYPDLDKLNTMMSWAAKIINLLLINCLDNELDIISPPGGYSASYQTFMGQNGQPVYAFLSFSFNVID